MQIMLKNAQISYVERDDFPLFVVLYEAEGSIFLVLCTALDFEDAFKLAREKVDDTNGTLINIYKFSDLLRTAKHDEEMWEDIRNLNLDIDSLGE